MDSRIIIGIAVASVITNVYSFILLSDIKEENKSLLATKEALENELYNINKKYQHKISLSEGQNKELLKQLKDNRSSSSKKEDISLKKLASNYNVPSMLIPESIDNMSEDELKENLVRFLKFKESDLPANMGLREFINKLIKIAMVDDLSGDDGIHIPEQQRKFSVVKPLPKDPEELKKMFSNSSGDNQNNKVDGSAFGNKMYTNLDLKGIDTERVLVKWVNKDSGKVLSYSYIDVKPNEVNSLTLEKKDSWEKGNYEAKVFTTGNEITQIASTSFEVE